MARTHYFGAVLFLAALWNVPAMAACAVTNTFVAGTNIQAAQVNQNFSDVSGCSGVSSLSGTANQISASASTGAITLSLPSAVSLPGSLTVSGVIAPSADFTYALGASSLRFPVTYTSAISDGPSGANGLLGSTSTTIQHGLGSSWTSQVFYTGGAPRATINNSGLGIGKTPATDLDILDTQNGLAEIAFQNASTASSARLAFIMNNSSSGFGLIATGTGWTTSGMQRADGLNVYSNGAGGLSLWTGTSNPIYFGITNAQVAEFNSMGHFLIGTMTDYNSLTAANGLTAFGTTSFTTAVSGVTAGSVSGDGYLNLVNSSGATDSKVWDMLATTTQLSFRATNDAYNAATNWLQVSRSGTTISSVAFPQTTTGTNADFACFGSGGVLLLQSTACTISSLRFKENVKPFTQSALDDIEKLTTWTYNLKRTKPVNKDPNTNVNQIGLTAENVAKVDRRCAIFENDMKTPKSYRQECIVALLVKGEQELLLKNDSLERQIAKLKVSLDQMKHGRDRGKALQGGNL